jgi:signal transduction histidine kinase
MVEKLTPVSKQENLRNVIEVISSELELRSLLTTIVRHACELLQADKGTIGLVSEEVSKDRVPKTQVSKDRVSKDRVSKNKRVIRTEAAVGMPEGELGLEMPEGVGIAGEVLKSQRPVVLGRYGDAARPLYEGMLEDAVIGMPIFWQDELIGFFGIGANAPRQFSQDDVDTLALLARHAAIAIHNAKLFAKTQQALGETQLLFEASQRMSMALDIDGVVEAYLSQVATRQRYRCTVATFLFDEAGNKTGIVTLGRWVPEAGIELGKTHVAYFKDDFDALLDDGQTVTISDVRADKRASKTLREAQLSKGYPALALIPLIVRGRRIGVVSLSDRDSLDWTDVDLRPYQVTAAQLALTLNSREQQQQLLEGRARIAVLEERQRIARDLHDSVNQLIFSMTLVAQSLGGAYQKSAAEGDKRVERVLELGHLIRSEMRSLLLETRSTPDSSLAVLQKDGLVKALQHHLKYAGGPGISLESSHYQAHPFPVEEAFFRICQEALTNVQKHAHARHVAIALSASALSIQDDGVGFHPQRAEQKERAIGLKSMRERAEAVGAMFALTSAPGQGTKICVTLV